MKFAILGVLIVLLIGFFVVVWKAARDWRWYHIVSVIFIMLLAVTLIFPTAGVLKSRAAWHQLKEDLEERAETITEEQQLLKYGELSDPDAEGIVQLTQQLSALGMEAGRRWRDLRVANMAGGNITLVETQDPQAAPGLEVDGDAPAVPAEPMIPESMVVYAFAESPESVDSMNPEIKMPIPTRYLGEFVVVASAPTQVTIRPLGKLGTAQAQLPPGQSWSLYEMLPLDGHKPFISSGSVPTDDDYFGIVDEALVRRVLGQGASEETINNYLRDGKRASQDDPPISRWTKIEFLKRHAFDIDSPLQLSALDGGFFDGNGRAQDSRLQVGGDGNIVFETGEQILVKEEAADQLIEDGVARLIDRYYLRPMNDYRFVLRNIRLRLAELEIRKEELAFKEQVLNEAIAKTVNMLNKNQEVKLKLEQDLAQVKIEGNAIKQYTSKIASNVTTMKEDMNRLHQRNVELENKLEQYHLEIQRRMDAIAAQ